MSQDENDELYRAVANCRDRQIAEFLTLAVGLAAERYPNEIRKALSQVFDLSAVEESAKRAMIVLTKVQEEAYAVRELICAVQADIDQIEERISAVEYRLDKAAQIVKGNPCVTKNPSDPSTRKCPL